MNSGSSDEDRKTFLRNFLFVPPFFPSARPHVQKLCDGTSLEEQKEESSDTAAGVRNPSGYVNNELRKANQQHQRLSGAFEKVSKILRSMDGLPLSVKGVQGISSFFRRTQPYSRSVEEPVDVGGRNLTLSDGIFLPKLSAKNAPTLCSSAEVLITLENSGKWPRDDAAVQRLKAAFYLEAAECFAKQFGAMKTFAGPHRLLVSVDWFVFSIRIGCPEELELRQKSDGSRSPAWARLERNIVYNPKICSFLNNFSVRWDAFGETCALAKRWISSHMMSSYIQEEAIELLLTHIFFHNTVTDVCDGFVKFLNLMGNQDWLRCPVIINLNESLSGSKYTRDSPSPLILDRLKRLGIAGARVIASHGITQESCNAVFRPIMRHFDVVIELLPRCLPRQQTRRIPGKKKKRKMAGDDGLEKALPVIDYDPAKEYLREIREAYGDLALFFFDEYGGERVGVLWKPGALVPISFTSSHAGGRKVLSSGASAGGGLDTEDTLGLNLEAAVEDFRIIGKGLVASVDVKRVGDDMRIKRSRRQ